MVHAAQVRRVRFGYLLVSVFSFETLFVLYLFAGQFKADPRFSWVPVDLTLLFMVVSMVGAVYTIAKRAKISRSAVLGVLSYLLFACWGAVSLLWAPQASYAQEKAVRILTTLFWAYTGAALVISGDPVRMGRFYRALVVFATWMAIEAMRVYLLGGPSEPRPQQVLGGNYLGVGRIVGVGLVVLLVDWLFNRRWSRLEAAVRVAGLALFAIVLLAAGGRGPLLATVFTILLTIGIVRGISRVTVLSLVVGVVILVTAGLVPLTTLDRLSVLITQAYGGVSAYQRLVLMEGALRQFHVSPLVGRGIGSFPYHYYGDPQLKRGYPHNIVLEVLAELGLVGMILLGLLCLMSIRGVQWKGVASQPTQLLPILLVTNAFINAFVSGDLPDNRFLFAALGLCVVAARAGKRRGAVEGNE